MRKIRTLRHWKQQYNKNAKFIWRRVLVYAGVKYKIGDDIPEVLAKHKTKLRRFWESKVIELAEFDDGSADGGEFGLDLPEGMTIPGDVQIVKGKGSWFVLSITGNDGEAKLNGKKALVKFIVGLVATRAEELERLAADVAKAADEVKEAEAELAQATADFIEWAATHGFELTAETMGEWTEEQSREVELYFEALDDEDADDPEDVPEVLPQSQDNPDDDSPDAVDNSEQGTDGEAVHQQDTVRENPV